MVHFGQKRSDGVIGKSISRRSDTFTAKCSRYSCITDSFMFYFNDIESDVSACVALRYTKTTPAGKDSLYHTKDDSVFWHWENLLSELQPIHHMYYIFILLLSLVIFSESMLRISYTSPVNSVYLMEPGWISPRCLLSLQHSLSLFLSFSSSWITLAENLVMFLFSYDI